MLNILRCEWNRRREFDCKGWRIVAHIRTGTRIPTPFSLYEPLFQVWTFILFNSRRPCQDGKHNAKMAYTRKFAYQYFLFWRPDSLAHAVECLPYSTKDKHGRLCKHLLSNLLEGCLLFFYHTGNNLFWQIYKLFGGHSMWIDKVSFSNSDFNPFCSVSHVWES